jgi:IclR family transcriptional regulator, acetate operon repressor
MDKKTRQGPRKQRNTKGKLEGERSGQVRSLSKALAIARVLGHNPPGIGLTSIARLVGLPVSTVHRLLTTLEQEHFVRFDRERSVWQIGVDAFVVGIAFVHARDVVAMARPFLRALMEESGETVNFAIRDGSQALYMSQVEARHIVRVIANPGERVHLHGSAVGKVLLAYMPESDLAKTLQELRLPCLTGKTIGALDRLRAELETTRRRGYAVDDEEYTADVRCVAGAVFNEHRLPVAAVSLSGPKVRMADDRMQDLGTLVHRVAAQITAEFGGQPPLVVGQRMLVESRATNMRA